MVAFWNKVYVIYGASSFGWSSLFHNLALNHSAYFPLFTPYSLHEKEDVIFVEDSPSLEAALPDRDVDDGKEDDDDEEDRSSLNDSGWVKCTDYLSTKIKSWREYNCSPNLFLALSNFERSAKIGERKIKQHASNSSQFSLAPFLTGRVEEASIHGT